MYNYIVKLYGKNIALFSIKSVEAENEESAVKLALSMAKKEVFNISVWKDDKELEIIENESEFIEHKGDLLQQEEPSTDDLFHKQTEMEIHVSECSSDGICEDA